MARVNLELRGMVEAVQKLEQTVADLRGQEFLDGIRTATVIVERDAKRNAPRDTGQLVNSITSEIRTSGIGGRITEGVVGSNVKHAIYQELGTGTFVGRPRHFPPPRALTTWARRHGTNAYAVAYAIYKRGGLEPKKFFEKAYKDNERRVKELIGNVVSRIVSK